VVITLISRSTQEQSCGVQTINQVLSLPKFLFNLPLKIKPLVFALFRAQVLIVDAVKRATLSRLLLESIISTPPGEKWDEKLATLALPVDYTECSLLLLSNIIPITFLFFSFSSSTS